MILSKIRIFADGPVKGILAFESDFLCDLTGGERRVFALSPVKFVDPAAVDILSQRHPRKAVELFRKIRLRVTESARNPIQRYVTAEIPVDEF